MTTTITWTFPEVQYETTIDGVISVSWSCVALDVDTSVTASMSGRVELASPVVLSDMTFDNTQALVFALLSQSEIESEVTAVLASKLLVPVICDQPPFPG